MEERVIDKKISLNKYLSWFSLPVGLGAIFLSIIPIVFAQLLQKFYPIIDNHYIGQLGTQALLIHNIQYSFISLGQYIGSATAISCLIFWKRAEFIDKQKSVLVLHVGLCLLASLICFSVASFYTSNILSYFSVDAIYNNLAKIYFHIGLVNMVLQSLYVGLLGIVIAANKEKLSLVFSIILLIINLLADSIALHVVFSGGISPQSILPVMLMISLSSSVVLLLCNFILIKLILKHATGWNKLDFKVILKVWFNELGGAFISGIYPILYIFQLGAVKSSGSLLITYQLIMQITSVLCIPLLATMQIALRDASAQVLTNDSAPQWWKELFYFGLIPTQFLLMLFILAPRKIIYLVFGYAVPFDQHNYLLLFLVASMIGQIGNILTVPIRAKKRSHLVTTSYFITDFIVMLGGMQLIIAIHNATPTSTGFITLLYTIVYLFINLMFALRV